MKKKARLYAVESNKVTVEGRDFDSTKFHLSVDLGEKSTGIQMGVVTRPFKFGTSEEGAKWLQFKDLLAKGAGMPVEVEFDAVSTSTGVTLALMAIVPDMPVPAAQKAQ